MLMDKLSINMFSQH